MVYFFFYNNHLLFEKINNKFEINDAYIIIENYNEENNILEISNNNKNNNKILLGKIVKFDNINIMENILKIIIKNYNTTILKNIWTTKLNNGGVYKAYYITI